MTPQQPGEEPKPFRCGECGLSLPIVLRMTPQAARIVCTYCGSRYLGEVWASIPDNLKGNIRVLKD